MFSRNSPPSWPAAPPPREASARSRALKAGCSRSWGRSKAERIRHLPLRLALGPCVGHGEGQGDAVGGVEEVAFFLREGAVQVEGEGPCFRA